jgi:hypothetical protein
MKKIELFVLMILVGGVVWASTIPTNLPEYKAVVRSGSDKVRSISDEAKFYLVTCEPGDEVYARFGHSGIRVYDAETGIDEVFHWGLFSFDTPNFVGRFIAGKTDYMMGVYGTQFFMREYIARGSAVYAQELDFTPEQKHKLWAKLWDNYRPENRVYRYNFITNNCATQPYQLILDTYNYKISLKQPLHPTTYRDIINKYVPVGSSLNTGINLIIGAPADKNITTRESVAFPMYTMKALNNIHYINADKTTKPIVLQQETMFNAPHKNFQTGNLTFYLWIIIPLILSAICATYVLKKKRYIPYLTQFVLLITGIVGIIISYLWFFSQHPIVNNNANILWCNPLNIALAVMLFIHKRSLRTAKTILTILSLVLNVVFLVLLILEVQSTTLQILAIWILVLTINATILYTYKKKLKKLFQHKKKSKKKR